MKHITISVLIAFLSVFCTQAKYNSLKITFTNGSEAKISLTDNTTIKFQDGNIIFCNPDEDTSYSLPEVEKYTYSDEVFSQITLSEIIKGECAGNITVYNIRGEKVLQVQQTAKATLPLQNLPKGVYILVDGKNQPTKIIR